jgi:hypothetical protein
MDDGSPSIPPVAMRDDVVLPRPDESTVRPDASTVLADESTVLADEGPSIGAQPTADGEEDDVVVPPIFDLVLTTAPPWLTSMVTHLVGFVILALILVPASRNDTFHIDAAFADRLGEQTEEFVMSIEPITVAPEETFDASLVELPDVESPLFAPPELSIVRESTTKMTPLNAPRIALALSGREAGRKDALLQAFGGTAETEKAVLMALQWLSRYQRRQGYWSLKGPFSKGSVIENREAATGMALLAFQGAGNTDHSGQFQEEVAKGWQFLLNRQDEEGSFFHSGDFNHRFYTHSIVTLALCELYSMTRDERWKEPAQQAIDYLVQLQSPIGGWRYDPAVDADTSVTGWVLLALHSGQAAGLHVPSKVFDRINHYLDLAATYEGARYGYKPGHAESLSMTAEALLCRQYLGWQRKDKRLVSGVDYLRDHPIMMREPNVYYWYYATQVMHHMEGDVWEDWNDRLRVVLPDEQVREGKEKGSWYFPNDRWGRAGGRLFTTCLNCYILEVYYRHLPIYSPVFRFE